MNVPTARERVSTNTSSAVNRESRSGLWIGALLIAVGLILAVLVALTPYNDTMPVNDTNNDRAARAAHAGPED
jgi:hypothetical protein